jgi:hypothetical protein
MREQELKGLPKVPTGRRGPIGAFVAADLVRRDFSGDGPNKLWVTDITDQGGQDLLLCRARRLQP